MGLYDDDDAAVTSGPVDDENYYYAMIWSQYLDTALKQRLDERGVKYILGQLKGFCDKSLGKFPSHEDLLAWKDKAEMIDGKIPDVQAFKGVIVGTLPGWNQEKRLMAWGDGHYALYLASQAKNADAKRRADNCYSRVGYWFDDGEEVTGHPAFPKAALEEIREQVKTLAGK